MQMSHSGTVKLFEVNFSYPANLRSRLLDSKSTLESQKGIQMGILIFFK